MKITGVKLTRCVNATQAPPRGLAEDCCIVELLTDAGMTGIGIGNARARAQTKSLAIDMVVGADPRSVTGIWQRMVDAQSAGRIGKSFGHAIAVLDVALWDLKAKANREPLWKTLGGARPRANAYASSIGLALGDEELALWYLRMARDYGLRAGKLQVSAEDDADLRRLGRMRVALAQATPEPVLMIDADHRWPVKLAIERVRAMEEQFDLTWVEGISRDRDSRGLKQLSDAIRGAVCVGKGFATIHEFLPHFQRRSADVIQIDINAIGITAALQVADAAFGLELPVTLSAVPGNIHAHLAGVMPGFMSMEVMDPDPAAWIHGSDIRIENGWAVAGDAPGNGLAVNRDAIAQPAGRSRN
jgi:L-alanine-DL-glutamate epimerase-like enolase superfamily enzyme